MGSACDRPRLGVPQPRVEIYFVRIPELCSAEEDISNGRMGSGGVYFSGGSRVIVRSRESLSTFAELEASVKRYAMVFGELLLLHSFAADDGRLRYCLNGTMSRPLRVSWNMQHLKCVRRSIVLVLLFGASSSSRR